MKIGVFSFFPFGFLRDEVMISVRLFVCHISVEMLGILTPYYFDLGTKFHTSSSNVSLFITAKQNPKSRFRTDAMLKF
jgi:hypothetical protein